MERLQKVIAKAGIASRRKAEELITQGRVSVNGEVITELGYKVDIKEAIRVDGKMIKLEEKVYYVMNKPKHILSSTQDDRDRKTCTELVDTKCRIFPVGRLDFDTTGLLLLTNDGDFSNLIIHPRYHLPKVYEVTIDGILETEMIKALEKGIMLEDGMTKPCKIRVKHKDFDKQLTAFDMTLREGRNRQIKRMMEFYKFNVTRLHRKQLGTLTITDLKPGEYRKLKGQEIKTLKELSLHQ
ncbi:MAG: pseudouridine synthase [Erysipelotrichaceae bacterium]